MLTILILALFPEPGPSLRVQSLGYDMAYYIADTLTDIRINPASAHGAFLYGAVEDTPGIGFANPDWVLAYSLDDVAGPLPYDPTYLTGALMVSRRWGTVWPFLRARARIISGPGNYGESGIYYDYRKELSLSLCPGLGFVRENWEGMVSAGYGLGSDTVLERGIFYYGYQPPTYKRSHRGNESGFAFETAHRLKFGQNEDLSWVGILSVQRLGSSLRDSSMYIIYDSLNHGYDTITVRSQYSTTAYIISVSSGAVRELILGPDARLWIGFTGTLNWEAWREKLIVSPYYPPEITEREAELLFSVPGAMELGFGPRDKRFYIRAGGRAFEVVRWETSYSAPDYDWPHISLDAWGFGLFLYEKFRLDMLQKGCWSCDPLDPFSYRFEMTYFF